MTLDPKPRTARAALVLTGKQRRYLRSLAHDMQAVLQIGKAGATKALLKELDLALEAHELIKIRTLKECPLELSDALALVNSDLGATTVGTVGRVAMLYRARLKDPEIQLPSSEKSKTKAAAAKTAAGSTQRKAR